MIISTAQNNNKTETDQSGLTMIELIVGLAVLALLSVMISSAIHTGKQVLERQRAEAEQTSMFQVRALLTKVIEEAQPISLATTEQKPNPFLIGSQRSLTFISSYAPAGDYGGLYLTSLSIDPQPGTGDKFQLRIVREIYRPQNRVIKKTEAKPIVLLSNLKSGSLNYLAATSSDAKLSWQSSWKKIKQLPRAIRIVLKRSKPVAENRPPLLIALPLSAK